MFYINVFNLSILNIYFHIKCKIVHLFDIRELIQGWLPVLLHGFSVLCLIDETFWYVCGSCCISVRNVSVFQWQNAIKLCNLISYSWFFWIFASLHCNHTVAELWLFYLLSSHFLARYSKAVLQLQCLITFQMSMPYWG